MPITKRTISPAPRSRRHTLNTTSGRPPNHEPIYSAHRMSFNPAIVSNTKLSFSRFNAPLTYDTSLQNTPTLFVSVNAQLPTTSTFIQLPGFYNFNPANGGLPFGGPQNTSQINQDFNVQKGRHSMRFGAQLVYIQSNNAYGAYAQAF